MMGSRLCSVGEKIGVAVLSSEEASRRSKTIQDEAEGSSYSHSGSGKGPREDYK